VTALHGEKNSVTELQGQSAPRNGRVHEDLPPERHELLSRSLKPELVSLRTGSGGRMVAYLGGHQAINQANRIFGYGRWGSEVVGPIGYRAIRGSSASGGASRLGMYWARVRVKVRGCEAQSDVGCAVVIEPTAEAHETAIKAAVTDGMKRSFRQLPVTWNGAQIPLPRLSPGEDRGSGKEARGDGAFRAIA
jgi:recombination DNA repair RAD52 pathway protein